VTIYRYQWLGESIERIRQQVPPGSTVTMVPPVPTSQIDVNFAGASATDKADLDDVLSALSWKFERADPPSPLDPLFVGSTLGLLAGEVVELTRAGGAPLILEDDKGYTIRVSLVARGSILGFPLTRSIVQKTSVRRTAGLSTISGLSVAESFGDAAAAWGMGLLILGAPDRFAIAFTTLATTSAVNVAATIQIDEV